ncbi:DUF4052 family protein [Bacillus wiedmannii]|uniref:DUF4052 family protein n=1 Tax=Bacillus wiedmannii TaxID=1890302 RepID=UPI000BEFFED8|nr:DUF4052 family protein [Bacillus wiedmannii]PEM53445.1 hypothetical protein CN618_06515 [Bacillus wiedmannii]
MELVYKIIYHRMQDHYLPKLVHAIRLINEEDLWKQGDSINSIGGTLFLSTNSVLYGEAGVTSLLFTSDVSSVDIPYFTVISIGLTVLYIITSSILIRKVSFEKTI